jgi:hypothetical protein
VYNDGDLILHKLTVGGSINEEDAVADTGMFGF